MGRPRTKPLPRGVYERAFKSGTKLWVSFAWRGKTQREPSPVQTLEGARLHRERRVAQVAAGTYEPGIGTGEQTLATYAPKAFALRESKGVRSIERERQVFRDHIEPHLGGKALSEITPRDIERWLDVLTRAGELAPKSVLNAHGVLSSVLVRARFDGLVPSIATRDLPPGTLPAPTRRRLRRAWRTAEVESLISDERVPWDRRVAYTIAACTGTRLGEVAGMRWQDIDVDAPDLWWWSLRTQYDGRPLKGSSTRGGERPRDVPIHPTLQRELARWRIEGWAQLVGRVPRPGDYVVPREDGSVHSDNSLGAKAVHRHAALLGIDDTERDFHSFRRWMITQSRAGGARDIYLERITHNAKGAMLDRYTYADWSELCSAVRCLRIEVRRSVVVPLRKASGGGGEGEDDPLGKPKMITDELHAKLHAAPESSSRLERDDGSTPAASNRNDSKTRTFWGNAPAAPVTQNTRNPVGSHRVSGGVTEVHSDPFVHAPVSLSDRLESVRELLAENGCDCPCDHHPEEHDDDCERCLACRIAEVVGQ